MTKYKTLARIDGALLMEEFCSVIVQNYLGSRNSKVEIFGTSKGGSFKDRVNGLMHTLNEQARFRNIDGPTAQIHAKDDKLDIVGWIPFKDNRPGQLIIFVQAKTGTSWRSNTRELVPRIFAEKWLDGAILGEPIRAFCVAEDVSSNDWNSLTTECGLLFDRCRLVSLWVA